MGMIKRPSALLIAAVMLLAMVPAVSFAAATIGIINGDEFCAYDTGIFGTEILVELNKGQTLPQTLKLKASGTSKITSIGGGSETIEVSLDAEGNAALILADYYKGNDNVVEIAVDNGTPVAYKVTVQPFYAEGGYGQAADFSDWRDVRICRVDTKDVDGNLQTVYLPSASDKRDTITEGIYEFVLGATTPGNSDFSPDNLINVESIVWSAEGFIEIVDTGADGKSVTVKMTEPDSAPAVAYLTARVNLKDGNWFDIVRPTAYIYTVSLFPPVTRTVASQADMDKVIAEMNGTEFVGRKFDITISPAADTTFDIDTLKVKGDTTIQAVGPGKTTLKGSIEYDTNTTGYVSLSGFTLVPDTEKTSAAASVPAVGIKTPKNQSFGTLMSVGGVAVKGFSTGIEGGAVSCIGSTFENCGVGIHWDATRIVTNFDSVFTSCTIKGCDVGVKVTAANASSRTIPLRVARKCIFENNIAHVEWIDGASDIDLRYNYFSDFNANKFTGHQGRGLKWVNSRYKDKDLGKLMAENGSWFSGDENNVIDTSVFLDDTSIVLEVYDEDPSTGDSVFKSSWLFGDDPTPVTNGVDIDVDDELTSTGAEDRAKEVGSLQNVHFDHNGDLPDAATITLPASEELLKAIEKAGSDAVIELYEVTDGNVSKVSAADPKIVTVNGEKRIQFTITHCSEYALAVNDPDGSGSSTGTGTNDGSSSVGSAINGITGNAQNEQLKPPSTGAADSFLGFALIICAAAAVIAIKKRA